MAPKKTRTDATIKRLSWTSVFGGLRATYKGSGFRAAYAVLTHQNPLNAVSAATKTPLGSCIGGPKTL